MSKNILFENIWKDDSLTELKVTVDDNSSKFSCSTYVDHSQLELITQKLKSFEKSMYGGIADVQLGGFGEEYANGACSIRLHFQVGGKIHLSVHMQSDFFDFGKKHVASEAYLYLRTEPALLANFISEISYLKEKAGTAYLECV